jgi:hypothetical protein
MWEVGKVENKELTVEDPETSEQPSEEAERREAVTPTTMAADESKTVTPLQAVAPAPAPSGNKLSKFIKGNPILAVVLALVVGIVIGFAAGSPSGTDPKLPQASSGNVGGSTSAVTEPTQAPVEEPPPAPSYTPSGRDFKLSLKILEKTCFGSAGCNLSVRVQVSYVGQTLDPSQTWEVTYEIRGGEDGPKINTFTVTGDQASVDQQELIQTTSANTKVYVVVRDVSGPN